MGIISMEKSLESPVNIDFFNIDIAETIDTLPDSYPPCQESSRRIHIVNSDTPEYDVKTNVDHMSIFFDSVDVQNNYIRSNSPLTISENNSDSSDDEELRKIRNERHKTQIDLYRNGDKNCVYGFKKKAYEDIEKSLTKYYDIDGKYSSKLDILITFIKGQKNVFIQSKNITHKKLHLLMVPILVFSATLAIVAPIIQDYPWSGGFVSGINVIITAFVTMMNYMKYESTTEKFLQLAGQYDKMEMSLELSNNRLLCVDNDDEKGEIILQKITEIEMKMNEVKELYHVLIPNEIKTIFPIVCSINIFSIIKKMENHSKTLVHKFKDVKNEIRFILYKWKNEDNIHVSLSRSSSGLQDVSNNIQTVAHYDQIKEKNRLLFLYEIKEKIKTELAECRNIYHLIDELFTKEIKDAEYKNNWFLLFFASHCRSIKKRDLNPVLDKYFHFIFED